MYEDLIKALQLYGLTNGGSLGRHMGIMDEAADAIAALQAENAEFLTQHRIEYCDAMECECVELGKMRAALSRVEAERDTANERGEYFREKADEEIKIRLNYGKELARVTAERDAAVADLHIPQDCRTCGNKTPWCNDNPDNCKGYKWRGAQGEA